MRTAWIVQTNVVSRSPAALRRACVAARLPFHEVSVVAGSPTLPEMPPIDGPVVLHGRTTLILRAAEHQSWRRGVFFDPATFRHSAYAGGFGRDLLNADAAVMSWDDLLRSSRPSDEELFIKPNDDLKHFTGCVMRFGQCAGFHARLRDMGRPVGPEAEIVVGRPCEIDAEFRLFFVAGAFVAGSMYLPSLERDVPRDLVRFAENAVARWAPASVFVLDVGRVACEWKIIECNCFNGSGFHAADVERLVAAVSEHQERAA